MDFLLHGRQKELVASQRACKTAYLMIHTHIFGCVECKFREKKCCKGDTTQMDATVSQITLVIHSFIVVSIKYSHELQK